MPQGLHCPDPWLSTSAVTGTISQIRTPIRFARYTWLSLHHNGAITVTDQYVQNWAVDSVLASRHGTWNLESGNGNSAFDTSPRPARRKTPARIARVQCIEHRAFGIGHLDLGT